MGIRSFEHFVQKVEKTFQSMQIEVNENAQRIAELIQNLNGVPADDEGFTGSIHAFMHKITLPNNSKEIIENAIEGNEKYGVYYSEELVKGDLDTESKKVVEEVIDTHRRHVDILKQMLQ